VPDALGHRTPSTARAPARIAFLGTPEAAVPALEAMIAADDLEVVLVVTAPDRPRGRHGTPTATPVRDVADRAGIAVVTPQRAGEIAAPLREARIDAAAVVAYGALLPPAALEACGAGAVNLHFSVLPRWRGAAPVQCAIRHGDPTTGVTAFVIDAGMDTGPVLASLTVPIGADEDAGALTARLAGLGAPLLVGAMRDLLAGVVPVPQPIDGVCLAPKITAADAVLALDRPAGEVVAQVRSLAPRPAAVAAFRGRRLKVLAAEVVDAASLGPTTGEGRARPPGTLVAVDDRGMVVACGTDAVRLTRVVPEGRAPMDGGAFVRGSRPTPGERVDPPTV
jgi:methionyl-tRNA formyltransferase